MDTKAYDKKAPPKSRKPPKDMTGESDPVKLTPQEEQELKDIKAQRASQKAPTTRSTMGRIFSSGGRVSSRGDGCAKRGKTRGKVM